MNIYFKNGETATVTQQQVNTLVQNMVNKPPYKWQFFYDDDKNVTLMINIEEISHIE